MAERRNNLIIFEEFLDLMNQVAGRQQQWRSFLYHLQRTMLADPQRFIDLVGGSGPSNLTVEHLSEYFRASEFVGVDPTGNVIVRFLGVHSPQPPEHAEREGGENADINILQQQQDPVEDGPDVLLERRSLAHSHQQPSNSDSSNIGASSLAASTDFAADASGSQPSVSVNNDNEPLPGRSDGRPSIAPKYLSIQQKQALKRDKHIANRLQNALSNEPMRTASVDDDGDNTDEDDLEVANLPLGLNDDNDNLDDLSESENSCGSPAIDRNATFNNGLSFANHSNGKVPHPHKPAGTRITKPLRKRDFTLRQRNQTPRNASTKSSNTKRNKFAKQVTIKNTIKVKKNKKEKTVIKKRIKRGGTYSIPLSGVAFSKSRNHERIIEPASCPSTESDSSSVVIVIRKKTQLKSKAKVKSKQMQPKVTCILCKKEFIRKDSLKRHMAEVHKHPDDPYYACPIHGCQSVFKSKRHLNEHMVVHRTNNIPLYPCPFCDQVFRLRQRLNYHMKKNHSRDL